MKKVSIYNLQNIKTHGAEFEDEIEMQSWISKCTQSNSWGKTAGFYPIEQLSESELAQEISRTVSEDGSILVEIPSQYAVVIEDITAAVEQEAINKNSLEYLKSTDWYVVRFMETGVPIPQNILNDRATARAAVVK